MAFTNVKVSYWKLEGVFSKGCLHKLPKPLISQELNKCLIKICQSEVTIGLFAALFEK